MILRSNDPFLHPHPSEPGPRSWTFSLGNLFRAVTLICVFFGWITLVVNMTPLTVVLIVLTTGVVLGYVVGARRNGGVLTQVIAALFFWAGSVWVAVYSGFLAAAIQTKDNPETPWDESNDFFTGGAMCLFPFVLVIMLLMLRAWTWSAHDATIHRDF